MPITIAISLFICLVFVVLFAASEALLAATNRLRLRSLLRAQIASEEVANSPANVEEFSIEAQRFIATVTIAANIPVLGTAALTMWLAQNTFGASWEAGILCVVVAIATIALLQVAPRFVVSRMNSSETPTWVRPARLLVSVLKFPVAILMFIGAALLRPLGLLAAARLPGDEPDGEEQAEDSEDDIRDLVESAQASGIIEQNGKELIDSIFTFGDTRVHEAMIPRPDILSLPSGSPLDAALGAFQESGFSRLPVHEGGVDHIVGILHVNDVLASLSEAKKNDAMSELMRAPMFLPKNKKIDEAFAAMRLQRTHLAIVIDEFGGTAGLLTIEDILEELVGEIADEHDPHVDEPLTILDDKTALADARLHIEDLANDWDLSLSSGKFDTIGGFVIEQLGRAPVVGDRVEVPEATLLVHAVRGRRPHRIKIIKTVTSV